MIIYIKCNNNNLKKGMNYEKKIGCGPLVKHQLMLLYFNDLISDITLNNSSNFIIF